MQEHLEASRSGRAAISLFILITIATVVVWNLPWSELKRGAFPLAAPYVRAAGLDQNWSVFAPDPRRHSLEVFARVTYADGTVRTFSVPRGGRLTGSYWDYRWRKWMEWTSTDSHQFLWEPAAAWFARRAGEAGERPTSVTLVRRWRVNRPPGPGPSTGEWREYAYFTYRIPSRAGGSAG